MSWLCYADSVSTSRVRLERLTDYSVIS